MSALPVPSSILESDRTPPVKRGAMFIRAGEAALRSGWPVERVLRCCRGEWANSGLAMLHTPQGGGKPCWHVREDASPAFSRVRSPENQPFDVTALTDSQRNTIELRLSVLNRWMDERGRGFAAGRTEPEISGEFVRRLREEGVKASRSTLFRWFAAYQGGGRAGLMDDRRAAPKQDPQREWFVDLLKRFYLVPSCPGVGKAYQSACLVAEADKRSVPMSLRHARRVLARIPRNVVAYHHEGPRAFDAKHGPYIERDYSNLRSNEVWCSDGYDMDVRCQDGNRTFRPVLLSWQDVRSRKIVGWTMSARAENADGIMAAFRNGVREHGLPESVYHDNGKAYDAKALQGVSRRGRRAGALPIIDLGVFPRLGVEVVHTTPYNAKAKPVERWHREVKEGFCGRFETYTGGSPDERPHNLDAKVAAGKCPTLDELRSAFADWVTIFHTTEHGGAGGTPDAIFAACFTGSKRVILEGELLLATGRRERLKVGRNGVRWRGLTYHADELVLLAGREVDVLIDPSDVGRVLVLHADGPEAGKKLCEAELRRKLDFRASEEDTREAIAQNRRAKRMVRDYYAARPQLALDMGDVLNEVAAGRGAPLVAVPESLQPVRAEPDAAPLRLVSDDADESDDEAGIAPGSSLDYWIGVARKAGHG